MKLLKLKKRDYEVGTPHYFMGNLPEYVVRELPNCNLESMNLGGVNVIAAIDPDGKIITTFLSNGATAYNERQVSDAVRIYNNKI